MAEHVPDTWRKTAVPRKDKVLWLLGSERPRVIEKPMPRQQTNSARPWLTVRVFISSTFRDMHAERDYLVRFVFPKLRAKLLPLRIHLIDVDLRWGVTGDMDALAVCREIVDECRPRFLCMLGERYGWIPDGKTRSITGDEIHYAVLDRPNQDQQAFFYFRDPGATISVPPEHASEYLDPPGSEAERRLRELKETIRKSGYKPHVYQARWDANAERFVGLEAFGNQVLDDLLAGIHSEFGNEEPVRVSAFAAEDDAMDAFVEGQNHFVVSGHRQDIVQRLLNAARGGDAYSCFCLTGSPGVGKTSLMAWLDRELRNGSDTVDKAKTKLFVLSHFTGACTGSTDVVHTMGRFCNQMAERLGTTANSPHTFQPLRDQFHAALKAVCHEQRVVILFDGLDLFEEAARRDLVGWLAFRMPDNCCLILSLTSDALLKMLKMRLPVCEIALPPLSCRDAEMIVGYYLQRYCKHMSDLQRQELLDKSDALIPEYLCAALEELRISGRFEEITERIRDFPDDTGGMFVRLCERLESDTARLSSSDAKAVREVTARIIACIGASQEGLSERELTELLVDKAVREDIPATLRLLRPYLLQRGELIDFRSSQMRQALQTRYLNTEQERRSLHADLAAFFRAEADPLGDGTWKAQHIRPLLAFCHHLVRSGAVRDLDVLFATTAYMQAVCEHDDTLRGGDSCSGAGIHHLMGVLRDIMQQTAAGETVSPLRERLMRTLQALAERTELLSRFPALLTQELANWLPQFFVISKGEDDCRVPDDTTLRVTHRNAMFEAGHSGSVFVMAVSSEGNLFVSGGLDGSVAFWDVDDRRLLWSVSAHKGGTTSVALSPSGRWALSAGMEGGLFLWDTHLADCRRLHTEHGKAGRVDWPSAATCAFIDEDTVFFSRDRRGQTLDVLTDRSVWQVERAVRFGDESAERFDFSAVSARIAFVDETGGVVLLNSRNGAEVARFQVDGRVRHVVFSRRGTHLLVADFQGDISVFDLLQNRLDGTAKGSMISAVCCGPNDDDFYLWELHRGLSALEVGGELQPVHRADDWRRSLPFDRRPCSLGCPPKSANIMIGLSDGSVGIGNPGTGTPLVLAGSSSLNAGSVFPDSHWALGVLAISGQWAGRDTAGTRPVFIASEGERREVIQTPHSHLITDCAMIDAELSVTIDKGGGVAMWQNRQVVWSKRIAEDGCTVCAGWTEGRMGVCATQGDCVHFVNVEGLQASLHCPGSLFEEGHPPGITAVAVAGMSATLMLGYRNGCVRCVRGAEGWKSEAHALMVTAAALSRDAALAATGSVTGDIILWNAASGTCLHKWHLHGGAVRGLAFSDNNTVLFTAGTDRHLFKLGVADGDVLCGTVAQGQLVDLRFSLFDQLSFLDSYGCLYVMYTTSRRLDGDGHRTPCV